MKTPLFHWLQLAPRSLRSLQTYTLNCLENASATRNPIQRTHTRSRPRTRSRTMTSPPHAPSFFLDRELRVREGPQFPHRFVVRPLEATTVLQKGPVLRPHLVVVPAAEEDHTDPLALKFLHTVCEVAIEDRGGLLDVQLPCGLVLQLLWFGLPVVLVPVPQLTTLEVAEGTDCRGPHIVAIPMRPGTIVGVDVDRSAHEVL
mmetsp:Transcript_130517/g.418487  ORF Transcript_130517/g.418487 Transcript_130517/m.418487 type:complete len:202 (+) Transcript_130517:39-644(+)